MAQKLEESKGKKGRKNIVELAKKGDWIIGTGGDDEKKSAGHGKVIYAMRVDETPTGIECLADKRFTKRMPVEALTDYQKKKQFALISQQFFYFGENAIPIPGKFKLKRPEGFKLEKKGPSFRSDFRPEDIRRILEWLKTEIGYKPGIYGKPCGKISGKSKGSERCKSSC